MFDFDATKFLIVGAAALIFIPPKDLPRVMRQAGQFVGKMKRMASEFQGQFMDAMREADMADLRREAQQLSESTRVDLGLDKLHDMNHRMTASVTSQPTGADHVVSHDPAPAAEQPKGPVDLAHEGDALRTDSAAVFGPLADDHQPEPPAPLAHSA